MINNAEDNKHYTVLQPERSDGTIIATIKHQPIETFRKRLNQALNEDFDSNVQLPKDIDLEPLHSSTGFIKLKITVHNPDHPEEFHTETIQFENSWIY